MGYAVKKAEPCIVCGEPTTNRRRRTHVPLCIECGVRRVVANIAEQARKAERNDRAELRTYKRSKSS